MARGEMTGRERILTTMRHKEPDRVPISPRVAAWLQAEFGSTSLATMMENLPDMDFMHIVGDGTLNVLDSYPDEYHLTEVKVDQRKYAEDDFLVVERTFHTPTGDLSDRTKIPPKGREFGVSPNPIKTEHVVKRPEDLQALRYILHEVNTNFGFVHKAQEEIGDRGVVMVCVRSALDHNAGYARDMQDLMMDYYDNRAFFDEMVGLFQERSLRIIKAALEGGVEFIFGSWYFNSLSAGWSPAIFEEVFVPQIREHVSLTHEYGVYYDYYDDGKLSRTMEMIADAGVDVLETCTPPPVGDFDLAAAKRSIGGKTTLKGYVDLLYVIKHGTPDLVERTVREAMEIAKPGGGFIIGSSDSFREGTPRENIDTYFDACKRYGKYA
ncbi:MAG: uroporphyrinogen decarboxylase family protein [Planctomycetota bacterium]